ncbi:M4 family metallopeptidase [Streptomyces sp. R302]|uniref:M4 family metallopeptidase n=1 Tax=unclassified Streptomyces TaxID=2593676 RepID=UPI00145E3B53|nr:MULTISPECIES: M4 family metallopeptidase [unclassified Streptomyces]NML49179.1 M4 family metallopeptidase [Streptomyces sp. R301]NML77506.1 M4 family metallopeptidase [Streptomyces sp. R302]
MTSPFCTIVPPHLLEHLAASANPAVAAAARRTLIADASARTARVLPRTAVAPSGAPAEPAAPRRTVYDAQRRTGLPGVKVRDEGEEATADATVNRAYAGLGATFALFRDAFGRDSMDGAGLPLLATVHYDEKYGNAFWNGEQMVFGDGDDEIFLDFTLPVDVIGHELAHGFTQYTANLEYFSQSGALNESVSDVFGSLVKQHSLGQTAEQADWLIGEGLFHPDVEGTALRSMKAPGTAYDDDVLGKDPQPAHMDDYVRTGRDNGGVHINSGIPNHAFYLVATELGGHAWDRAGRIWYDVMTGGTLTPETRFSEFAAATVAAAKARYGDAAEIQAVTKAWAAVGVPTD